MGSVCCCLQVEDFEEYVTPSRSVYRNCICLRCFVQNFLNAYAALFSRGEVHAIQSSVQGATSLSSTPSIDNSLLDTYRSPPRPLPCDADPRRFRSQRDGLVSRREKGSGHSHEESEPLRASDSDAEQESLSAGGKWNGAGCDGGPKERRSESSLKHSLAKVMGGVGYVYSSAEEEDFCPTCLEEYTPENPKIMTKCSHHFHLGCIYEWMERSDSCPVCGKQPWKQNVGILYDGGWDTIKLKGVLSASDVILCVINNGSMTTVRSSSIYHYLLCTDKVMVFDETT